MISGTAPLIAPLDSDLEAERRGCEPSRPGAPDRHALANRCEACALATTCIGRALCSASGAGESLCGYARTVEAGQALFHAGAVCTSIGVIETGFFKTVALAEDGIAQVTGFHLSGDVLGLDAFGAGIHRCDVIAMSRASVCILPRARLLRASADDEALARRLFGALSDDIAASHRALLLLGSRRADERVAAFIAEIADRLAARGYSSSDLGLWMTRADIGSYLGLEVETVSRVLGRLRERLLVDVHRRHVHIRSVDALRDFMAGDASTYRRTVPRPDRGALKRAPSAGREPHRAHAARPTGSES